MVVLVVILGVLAVVLFTVGYVTRVNFMRRQFNDQRSQLVRRLTMTLFVAAGAAGLASAWATDSRPLTAGHVIFGIVLLGALVAFAVWRFGQCKRDP